MGSCGCCSIFIVCSSPMLWRLRPAPPPTSAQGEAVACLICLRNYLVLVLVTLTPQGEKVEKTVRLWRTKPWCFARYSAEKTKYTVKVARLQSEFCTKDFFRATNFVTKNAPKISPKLLSLCSVGSENPAKFPQNFPLKFPNFPPKNQKKITDELLQERRENTLRYLNFPTKETNAKRR